MEQTKALNALEPFLALTKSASSPRAAADLITRATSHPNTFIFSELLEAPQIQALSEAPDYAAYLTILKIFSYGTYTDYHNTPNLPALNDQQTLKLRQLSFLALAKHSADLTYTNVLQALGLETPRELEDLVITAIYAGLISGTLDPYRQLVCVSSVSPLRDLPPNTIPSMLSTLQEWSSRCVSTLADLERQIVAIKADAKRRHREEREWSAHVEKLIEGKMVEKATPEDTRFFANLGRKLGTGAAAKRGSGMIGMGRDAEDGGMDVDDEEDADDRRGSKPSKKRGVGNLS